MRLKSETRRPGMVADRRCLVCRAPLDDDDDNQRCHQCRPQLSTAAQQSGIARAELTERDREIHHIENTIKCIERALRKWPAA